MIEDVKRFAEHVRAEYHAAVAGPNSRINRGAVLWDQFEAAVEACLMHANSDQRILAERTNELAVAKRLTEARDIPGPIEYEPDFFAGWSQNRFCRRPWHREHLC